MSAPAGAINKKSFDIVPYLFIAPATIFLLGVTFYPFISSLIYSFFDYSFTRVGMEFVGFQNYIDIIEEGDFVQSIGFTLKYVVLNLILVSILAFSTALLLKQKLVGGGILKAIMLIPWILPQVVTGYIWSMMFSSDMGIINTTMQSMGLVENNFSFFATGETATIALVLAQSWKSFPFVALMLYSKMQAIPQSQIEAAQIDGASALDLFRHITIPYIAPVYMTCMMLSFIWTFNAFDIVKVMTNGGPIGETTTLSLLVQREAFTYLEISRSCTMAVMMFLMVVLILGGLFLLRKLIGKVVARNG